MRLLQWNEPESARREVLIQMVDGADPLAEKTGLSLSVEIAKAGGSYAAMAGTASEVGQGTYRIALAAGDVDTEGPAMLRITAAGALNQYVPVQVLRLPGEVHLAKAALVNGRRHTIDTGVNEILDDDGETVVRTLTPSESGGVVEVTAG